ncbi:hypothetical protein GWI34_16410 [Actinomadura sp. DSM 109109]|nr:hypothetical protein [Actinomadura lepetitiana]
MAPRVAAHEVPTIVLEPSGRAPALARRFVGGWFQAWEIEDDSDARVVVSELVTNALLHGEGPTLRPQGWRFVKLYRPAPVPLLRVYANGTEEVAIEVSALPVPGGAWAYHDARLGRRGYLHPCGDAGAAAEVIGHLLKHRMFPSTW